MKPNETKKNTEEILKPYQSNRPKKYRPRSTHRLECFDSKEKVVRILKDFYFSRFDRFEKFAKSINKTPEDVTKAFYNLKRRWDIKPKDIGLKYYPKVTLSSEKERNKVVNEARL